MKKRIIVTAAITACLALWGAVWPQAETVGEPPASPQTPAVSAPEPIVAEVKLETEIDFPAEKEKAATPQPEPPHETTNESEPAPVEASAAPDTRPTSAPEPAPEPIALKLMKYVKSLVRTVLSILLLKSACMLTKSCSKWPKRSAEKNYFMVPNEIFSIFNLPSEIFLCNRRQIHQIMRKTDFFRRNIVPQMFDDFGNLFRHILSRFLSC